MTIINFFFQFTVLEDYEVFVVTLFILITVIANSKRPVMDLSAFSPESELLVTVVTPRTLYRMKRDTIRLRDRADAELLKQRFKLDET